MATWMTVIAALIAQDESALPTAPPAPAPYARPLENAGFGPLRLATQSPFPALRLSIAPEGPSTLPEGRWELRETLTWSRIWGQSDRYLLSFETLNATHSAGLAVSERLRLDFGLTQVTRFGGKLDGFVRAFHETMGIDQGGRDSLARGAFAFELRGDAAARIDERSARLGSEYAFATLGFALSEGSDVAPAVTTSLSVKTDLGDSDGLDGNAVEFAGSLGLAKRFGGFHAYADAGASWHGRDRFYGVELRPIGLSFLAALEWGLAGDFSLVFQYLWTSGAAVDLGPFSRPSNELSLGAKIAVSDRSVLEFAVTENLAPFDNSPDFGLHAGLTSRF
jgi:hypothetical protein